MSYAQLNEMYPDGVVNAAQIADMGDVGDMGGMDDMDDLSVLDRNRNVEEYLNSVRGITTLQRNYKNNGKCS